MSRISFGDMGCSIARTLDVVGERWTLLIVREAFGGVRRFEEFLARLPIARNVLADRLNTLVAGGVMERVPYQERPERHEYRLTASGRALYPVLIALMQWGEEQLPPASRPSSRIVHRGCGSSVGVTITCDVCGETVSPHDTKGLSAAAAPED